MQQLNFTASEVTILRRKFIIIRPHRSTTYVDAAYCYRPNSVVFQSVRLSICLSVTVATLAKTAEAIEIPSGLWWAQGSMY